MLSYWERKNFIKHDFIIIGAGIVGLSTAIQYQMKYPDRKVLVLERGIFPCGASTKNAGFACFGSLTEILDDLEVMSESAVLDLIERRYKGILAIRKFFGDKALDYHHTHGFELITNEELGALEHLEGINKLMFPLFGKEVFSLVPKIKDYGFGKKVSHLIRNTFEGELDSGKFINSLWDRCGYLGIKILTGAEVEALDPDMKQIHLKKSPFLEGVTFQAKEIAICTNAFAKELIPDLNIRPGRGLVMVTEPLENEIPWKGTYHYNKGYVYFRRVDNRLLIGGGRDVDFEAEETTEFSTNEKVKSYLMEIIETVVFPSQKVRLDLEWTGIMAFGPDKKPIVDMPFPGVGIAARLGGMGVAIGWQTAEELIRKY